MIRSPFFYVGDKFKILNKLIYLFPPKINKFIEPFTGGGSVFLNIIAKKYILNDIDNNIILIHKKLQAYNGNYKSLLSDLENIIFKYNLSRSYLEDIVPEDLKKEWKKTYYQKFNRAAFNKARDDFNLQSEKDILLLYILMIYGFNRMIRFNSNNHYNVPVGNVDFNKNVVNSLINYSQYTKNCDIQLNNKDYKIFLKSIIFEKNDFIYFDPPYLITFSEYNKLWNEENEKQLLETLDDIHAKGIKFALSNVTDYKGRENKLLKEWMVKYTTHNIKSNYISYHDNSNKDFNEVLITNY